MSTFIIKQKVLTVTDEFTVLDEKKNPRYFVKGNLLGDKKLTIYSDEKRKELIAEIKEKKIFGETNYEIILGKKKFATMKAKKSGNKPEFKVEGTHWVIKGDLTDNDFKIAQMIETIADIHKQRISVGDSYKVEVKKDENNIAVIALVLAIDAVLFDE